MIPRTSIIGRSMVILVAAVSLTGCGAPGRQLVETSPAAPVSGAQTALGVVASVRPVIISGGQIGAMAGVNAVLDALSQQPIDPPLAGEEIVIRKGDGNAVVVEQGQVPSLAAGDRVALIASSAAVIIHRN